MPVLGVQDLQKAYGDRVLFGSASFTIEESERLGVVGRNGSGKSTLAKMLAEIEGRDEGILSRRKDARVVYLAQEPVFEPTSSARQVVEQGLDLWSKAKNAYQTVTDSIGELEGAALDRALSEQARLLADVERLGGWERDFEIERMLTNLGIQNPEAPVGKMSGGQIRRVALAQSLLSAPDLLLLDEPTNHLDADTIDWLETYLSTQFRGALLLVTHDRWLLDQVATRTLEISHGNVYSYDGGYGMYLTAKSERMMLEARAEQNRQNFLRKEVEWLRRQPKARTTKQKARIERAEDAIGQSKPKVDTTIELRADVAESGKVICDLRGIEIKVADRTLLRNLNMTINVGDRVGIIGPNGIGKSTLLRAIMSEHPVSKGSIVLGRRTQIGYLDQMRGGLDDSLSVYETVAAAVPMDGKTRMEPRSYLERFGFGSSAHMKKVGMLSGGERARLCFARVLASACNLLLLDEPSNDLDIETLSALEDFLTDYAGSVLVVTHDRYFLDRVSTSILAFEGDGKATIYAGAYQAYAAAREYAADTGTTKSSGSKSASDKHAATKATTSQASPAPKEVSKGKKLSNNEQKELDSLPAKIEALEAELAKAEEAYADPALYTKPDDGTRATIEQERIRLRAEIDKAMARWEVLESKASG
jgi:ABC transport system ATP-binding/permease protein